MVAVAASERPHCTFFCHGRVSVVAQDTFSQHRQAVTAIAGGVLDVSSGYSTFSYMPGNVLLAFSVAGQ